MSRIARVLSTSLALTAAIASAAGVASFLVTERHRWAWLAIGGLLALSVSLGWQLWAAERSLKRVASRRTVIDQLGLLARLGRARLQVARLAGDDAAALSQRYQAWERDVCKVIEEGFGHGDLSLFEGPVSAPMPADVAGVAARWRDSLDRLGEVIVRAKFPGT